MTCNDSVLQRVRANAVSEHGKCSYVHAVCLKPALHVKKIANILPSISFC